MMVAAHLACSPLRRGRLERPGAKRARNSRSRLGVTAIGAGVARCVVPGIKRARTLRLQLLADLLMVRRALFRILTRQWGTSAQGWIRIFAPGMNSSGRRRSIQASSHVPRAISSASANLRPYRTFRRSIIARVEQSLGRVERWDEWYLCKPYRTSA